MNDIKFNCPGCSQSLAIDAASAGATVNCPQCGQTILVPKLARMTQPPLPANPPARAGWGWLILIIGIVAVLATGALVWQMHRPVAGRAVKESATLTPQMLSGKRFRFSWKTDKARGDHGILTFHDDGTLSGGTGSPNESFWAIDQQGQLIFKHRDGRVSTIFTQANQWEGKWLFSGPYQFERGVQHSLEETADESASRPAPNQPRQTPQQMLNARRVKALTDALQFFQQRDPETANLLSAILDSLHQPSGLGPNALADDLARMKNRVRELVRRGDMESASALNYAQIMSFYTHDFPPQPPHPNVKLGGTPGPGGLVLYFPFDAPDTNGVVHDESGAGNDGQVFGAQWVPNGKFGGAYRFSVSNFTDRIVIPNSETLNSEDITLTAWIKASANTGLYERIFDKDFYHGFALSLSGDWQNGNTRGKLLWETGNGTVMGHEADDNQWHHVAAAYDGRTVRCYVDGVETSHRARKTGPLSTSGWDLCIGNTVVDYGWEELMAFDGLIDEVRVYNRALSAGEIQSLATATNGGADVLGASARFVPQARNAEWLAWAKKLPISPNPLPQDTDRSQGLILKDFSDYPLFGPPGPSKDDVLQGSDGDCNFMARLAGLAGTHPDFIEQIVNDVGDGTYIVHFMRVPNQQQFIVRVSGDLWVDQSGNSRYARIGRNRPIWPAIRAHLSF